MRTFFHFFAFSVFWFVTVNNSVIGYSEERPNILWLTCEDIGRHLGCYDFPTAETPTLDRLAKNGMLYRHAWSNCPVCSAARTTIITGCYPASLGAEQHRSSVPLPDSIKMYPYYLRQAGYYCTNNDKEDYNVFDRLEKSCWDASNKNAHWSNRKENQPFFAIFNFGTTHESQIRNKHELCRDPDKTPVPKYHPDVPEIRRDWAQYHDRITQMDTQCAKRLNELEKAGLADETIVFFYGDHGSRMPRNKRTPLDCGLGVPLIVYFPPKYRHLAPEEYRESGASERLVSFVDLAPTVLSLAGIEPPKHMQGIPFAGEFAGKREYVFGFRGRMDERSDLTRSISDGRYVYARNYHPEIIYGARNDYMFQTRSTQVWRDLYDAEKLATEQVFFWRLKPSEELYDLKADPDEIVNLADSAKHRESKNRLKAALTEHTLRIRDAHFLPENMLHERYGNGNPWDMGHDSKRYPLKKILAAADAATNRSTSDLTLIDFLADTESAVRYWGMIGLLLRLVDTAGPDGTTQTKKSEGLFERYKSIVLGHLADEESAVRIVAAEILGRFGNDSELDKSVRILFTEMKSDSAYAALVALESFDRFAFRCDKSKAEFETLDDANFKGRIKPVFMPVKKSIERQLSNE